jgi:hypothetical protein
MELFNKYKNKNFTFLTNYINTCINDESKALTSSELKNELVGSSQSTYDEFLKSITNNTDSDDDYVASLLYNKDGKMLPLRQVPVPVRPTIAEKSWLYYILLNDKSYLFLSDELRSKLIEILENDFASKSYSISNNYIDIRQLSPYNILQIDNDYIEKFKRIVTAIRSHKYIRVTNHSFNGVIYESQKIIPYKLEYSSQFDSFSLSCYPLDAKRPVKMNLKNLSDVEIEEAIPDYESFISYFEQQLRETLEHEPIVIEIINKDDAYDRSVYLFSSYNTYCYDIGNDTLQMHIYYYRFQKEEIIRNILFLGHYIKVVSPTNIADKIIKIIQAAYSNYE